MSSIKAKLKCPCCGVSQEIFDPYLERPKFCVTVISCWTCGKEAPEQLWQEATNRNARFELRPAQWHEIPE